MSHLCRLVWIVVGLWLLCFSPASAQEKPAEEPWTGKLADGRVITKVDLDRILQDHKIWLESNEKKGKKANLSGAKLWRANLSGASLSRANLSGADLWDANLSKAILWSANLSRAILDRSNLSGADLKIANLSGVELLGSNMSGADLLRANLSGAKLLGANLMEAELRGANLRGARFEPQQGTLPGVVSLLGIEGLDSLTFDETSSYSLVELREIYKKAGMRDEERQVTFSLKHTRRENLWGKKKIVLEVGKGETKRKEEFEKRGLLSKMESLFHLVFFEWTCDYGMSPGRPLQIMGFGLLLFIFPYLLGLRSRDRETGIWLLLPSDRVLDRKLKDRPFKLITQRPFRPLPENRWAIFKAIFGRGWRALRLAFYFSLLSAFHIGWRDLNVGSWIARLQRREYNLRATGWVRTVSGFQSLLSVYMLALWALSYFGRPFE